MFSPPLFDGALYNHCPENFSFDLEGMQMLNLLSSIEVRIDIYIFTSLESRYRYLFPPSDAL